MQGFSMLPPLAIELLLEVTRLPTPFQLHLPMKLTEYEYVKLADRFYQRGLCFDDLFDIKVKKVGHHRMFTIKGLKVAR